MASGKDAPIQRLEDELFEKLYAGEAELLPERSRDSKWAAWASAIHDACDKLPAFNRLADETRGDADAAALGVEKLLTGHVTEGMTAHYSTGWAGREKGRRGRGRWVGFPSQNWGSDWGRG